MERTTSPRFFYTLGYRLAQAYGLKEQPLDPLYKGRLAWFANPKTSEQVEVYGDSIVVRTEGNETHRLVIADV
jgi:hypothetical protein